MAQETLDVAVLGQIGRDLILLVDGLPAPGDSAPIRTRRELLGGKGANQAVGLSQLGLRTALIGVVGDDPAGRQMLAQAAHDGIAVDHVRSRAGAPTALLIDLVDEQGRRRLLEDVPAGVLLSVEDVTAAGPAIQAAGTVVVQLQQPAGAALLAARTAREAGRRVVLDGAAPPEVREEILDAADVLRADQSETEILCGHPLRGAHDAVTFARDLGERHDLELVALDAGDEGNVVVWPGGQVVLPLSDVPVADRTGAGDAFIAALTAALIRGADPEAAARLAGRASTSSVTRLGGRPDLTALQAV
jgi:ribokinase